MGPWRSGYHQHPDLEFLLCRLGHQHQGVQHLVDLVDTAPVVVGILLELEGSLPAVVVGSLPAVVVGSLPAVVVDSLPAVVVCSLPVVVVGSHPAVVVDSLPAVVVGNRLAVVVGIHLVVVVDNHLAVVVGSLLVGVAGNLPVVAHNPVEVQLVSHDLAFQECLTLNRLSSKLYTVLVVLN